MRKTVVFDWDETLAHSTSDQFPANGPPHFQYQELTGHLRPGVHQILQALYPHADLMIFTLGTRGYIEAALQQTGLRPYFRQVYARENAPLSLKEIRLINPDPRQILLVDNSLEQVIHNQPAAVKISDWKGSPQSNALHHLLQAILPWAQGYGAHPVITA